MVVARPLKAALLLCAGLLLLGGCMTGKIDNPNRLETAVEDPERLLEKLNHQNDRLQERVLTGELNQQEKDDLIQAEVAKAADAITPEMITPATAYAYGELFRKADRWERSFEVYQMATESPATESRRVIDTLQFARVAAHLGKIDQAISLAEAVFDTPPTTKESILPAVLYEILEEGLGQGRDEELADMLHRSIGQHLEAVVDEETPEGQAFLQARPFHLKKAWSKLAQLYNVQGRLDEARRAVTEADAMGSDFASI
jgi:tetratricopeptide (TPR) repeat protein